MIIQNYLELFLQQTITFFAILDPIGVSAVMLSILHINVTKKEIEKVAYKSTLTIVIAFFIVFFAGNILLSIFGVNINAIKVIGGIILLLMSIKMIQDSIIMKENNKNKSKNIENDLSIVPIAIPILFGPGIFSTIIIMRENTQVFSDIIITILAFLLNSFFVYIIFKNSIYIKKILNVTGQNIITKLMGLIVGAISVQFIISGIIELSKIYLQ